MNCPQCHQANPPASRFCSACGAQLLIVCPACRADNAPDSRFCSQCGQVLSSTEAAPLPIKFASPQRYTPAYLAERILTSRESLEGERKHVTVLFADLKGSLELLSDRDPEDARKLLDPVLDRMMEAVHQYEGTVNQVMGDGVMALFGAPLAHEDHAVRACYAALRMQDSVRQYATEVQRMQGIPLHIRVGLNSGEVVVRSIGSDLRMDYTAVGQTAHLAARMEQMAMPGTILITSEVLRLVEGYVQVRPLGPVPVKGMNEPVQVFEITDAAAARTRFQATAIRGLTRFVGRVPELDALQQALHRVRDGHGQLVSVVGEPGVGKSRLFWEFTHSHRTEGCQLLESASVSYGKATAYLPVIDLLKGYFEIEPRDDARRIRERVTGKLLTLDKALEPSLPALMGLLDPSIQDPAWQALDSQERRQQILDAVKRVLIRESRDRPLIVLFEDLHWIDSETQALLDALVESLPATRILLLVNHRPEYQHAWGTKASYTQLRIEPLSPEGSEELLQALLGDDPGLQPLKRLLIKSTEGNPFFAEESVRTLIETGALAGERGAFRLTTVLPAIRIPPTVQAVLGARIDRLPPEEKRILQAAAVIGKDVPLGLLRAIADLPDETLRGILTHLQAAEFLYETTLFPDLEYAFKHALTHEVAYGGVLQDRRRALHARILEAMERLYADHLSDQVERLAQHAFRGEVWDKALSYLDQAFEKARMRSAHREAVTLFEQGLEALRYLPESRDRLEWAADVRARLQSVLMALGDPERMLDNLQQRIPLAEALGDQSRLARIYASMPYVMASLGDPAGALEAGARALDILSSLGDPDTLTGSSLVSLVTAQIGAEPGLLHDGPVSTGP